MDIKYEYSIGLTCISFNTNHLDLGPMSKYYEIVDTLRVYDGEVGSNQPPSKEYSSGNIKQGIFPLPFVFQLKLACFLFSFFLHKTRIHFRYVFMHSYILSMFIISMFIHRDCIRRQPAKY